VAEIHPDTVRLPMHWDGGKQCTLRSTYRHAPRLRSWLNRTGNATRHALFLVVCVVLHFVTTQRAAISDLRVVALAFAAFVRPVQCLIRLI
jgi:hypothetical protein